MTAFVDHSQLHRTAKLFMDSGQVSSTADAMTLLRTFALSIYTGPEISTSETHQAALLTFINVARRTFLGGVEVVNLPDVPSLTVLAGGLDLRPAVLGLKGNLVSEPTVGHPVVVIGSVETCASWNQAWRITWEGWRGGVVPVHSGIKLADDDKNVLAALVAAGAAASEVFSYFAKDSPFAGKRSRGISLWSPGSDWLENDVTEGPVAFLPSRLWLVGLGNLGQAFSWCIAALPFSKASEVELVLQDFDRIAISNESTSLLSDVGDDGRKKTRVVAEWLDQRGFQTVIEERRFGKLTRRDNREPAVVLCGVDNAVARSELGLAGFELIVEVGLGAGPQSFRSIIMHTFPASRTPEEIWSRQVGQSETSYEHQPAYQILKREGMDSCGLAQLASRTVGVPFVGLLAGCLAISELLRRVNGGGALEVCAVSSATLEHAEFVEIAGAPYAWGHISVRLETSDGPNGTNRLNNRGMTATPC